MTVPVMSADTLPTAVQLIAAAGNEAVLLRAARRLERMGVCGAPVAAAAS